MSQRPIAVVAFGGNALVGPNNESAIDDQYQAVMNTAGHVIDMIEAGWNVVLTHGNGPQVGFLLRRSELACHEVHPIPLDYAVSDTQGATGYMFQKALRNEMAKRQSMRPVVSLVTQTMVDKNDPAFAHPSKPIGSFMSRQTAEDNQRQLGWTIVQDSGRGWRRTVASPKPQHIVELETIKLLLDSGTLVIACGGGGIAVSENTDGHIEGVEAVIDKDLSSALLAQELGANLLVIGTSVEKAAINFGRRDQQWLDMLTAQEAQMLVEQGQFGEGSMQPKVEALLQFVAATQDTAAVITRPDCIGTALKGETGTWIGNRDRWTNIT